MKDNILSLDNYVTITQNNIHVLSPEDFVHICKRENNSKRDFLFVNSLQGKHIHANPLKIFSLYNELVSVIQSSIDSSEKVVVIGFAETATAIGHYIASCLPNCFYYLQTTREVVNAMPLLEFKEEHSHATNQILYGDVSKLIQCDRIIFVDDEISTGNTVLNFIHALEKLGISSKFSVASFLNWQDDAWTNQFQSLGIDIYFVVRGKLKDLNAKVPLSTIHPEPLNLPSICQNLPTIFEVSAPSLSFSQERVGSIPQHLEDFSNLVYSMIGKAIEPCLPKPGNDILVLGTEEYMFVPMVFAKMLSKTLPVNVQFHATTRSPIETSSLADYALHQRYPIASPYETGRNTYIYNLEKYDKVYIITDVFPSHKFIEDISSALVYAGCDIQNIFIITVKG